MLKKASLLTRSTLTVISAARPESAKTDSSPWAAPCPKQGRSELSLYKGGWDDPNCAQYSTHLLSARQDAFYPERRPFNSLYLSLREWPRLPSTARIERPASF
jgi:hypothetical protein